MFDKLCAALFVLMMGGMYVAALYSYYVVYSDRYHPESVMHCRENAEAA